MPPQEDTAVVFQVAGCKARGAPPSDSKVKRGVTELITYERQRQTGGKQTRRRPLGFLLPCQKLKTSSIIDIFTRLPVWHTVYTVGLQTNNLGI